MFICKSTMNVSLPRQLGTVLRSWSSHLPPITVGDEGVIADFSYMSIFSQVFGLPATVLLPVTHCTHQICGLNCVV